VDFKKHYQYLLEPLRYVLSMREGTYFTYIVASRSCTLYVGMTSNLQTRVFEHKDGTFEGFSSRYNCNRLVWFEIYDEPLKAINREKRLNGWRREKKIALIEKGNPTRLDLSEGWYDFDPSLERKYMAREEE
jgi:putative endonuclease